MKKVNVTIDLTAKTFAVAGAREKTAVFFSLPTIAQLRAAKQNKVTTITVTGYNVDECTIRNFNLTTIAKGLVIAGLKVDRELYTAQGAKCVQDECKCYSV